MIELYITTQQLAYIFVAVGRFSTTSFFQQEAFTRVFCQNYQKIAKALVLNSDSRSVEQLSNRVVHVSVQLFSNKILAEKVVREQNLLHIMVKVLHDMARPSLVTFRRGGRASNKLLTLPALCQVKPSKSGKLHTVKINSDNKPWAYL